MLRISFSIFFLPNLTKCSGLLYFGYIFLVTLLTFTSVHCADKRTETSKVKIFLCLRGIGVFGYILFKVRRTIFALCSSLI